MNRLSQFPSIIFTLIFLILQAFLPIQASEETQSLTHVKEEEIEHHSNALGVYYRFDSSYEEVRDALEFALEELGIVISATLYPQNMLARTQTVVRGYVPVYGNAKMYVFCKAGLSHELVSYSPEYMTLCPIVMTVYDLANQPDHTYITYRNPPQGYEKVFASHLKLLRQIINYVQDELE